MYSFVWFSVLSFLRVIHTIFIVVLISDSHISFIDLTSNTLSTFVFYFAINQDEIFFYIFFLLFKLPFPRRSNPSLGSLYFFCIHLYSSRSQWNHSTWYEVSQFLACSFDYFFLPLQCTQFLWGNGLEPSTSSNSKWRDRSS